MIYCKEKQYTLYQGKMQEVIDSELQENSIDAIITDPPYELNFMNKGWDNSGVAFQKDTWERCLKVLKPGGYLLAFGGTRTFHRIACAIEDAGFEIRDTIMWLYGSGFPKSHNVGLDIDKKNGVDNRTGNIRTDRSVTGSIVTTGTGNLLKEYEERKAQNKWAGYGTCLKPSYEPIIMARKPLIGTIADNIMKYSTGAINIDECRVPYSDDKWQSQKSGKSSRAYQSEETTTANGICEANDLGRFPANTILTYDDNDKSEVCKNMDTEDNEASRYFYNAKASKKDRDEGLDEFETKRTTDGCIRTNAETARKFGANSAIRKNIHPTVKPIELMQYLIKLVSPKGATILDPFMGSGSTGKACMFENRERNANYHFIGIEMTPDYLPICQARIDYALNKYKYDEIKEENENRKKGIMNLFDEEEN